MYVEELNRHAVQQRETMGEIAKDLAERQARLKSKDCPEFIDPKQPKVSDATLRTIQAHLPTGRPKEPGYAKCFEGRFRGRSPQRGKHSNRPTLDSYASSSSVFATPTTPGNTKYVGYSDSDVTPPGAMSAVMYDEGDNLVKPQPGFKMAEFLKQWDLYRTRRPSRKHRPGHHKGSASD
jgi:hypothetical protein